MGSEGLRCAHGDTVTACAGCVKQVAALSLEVERLRAEVELTRAALEHERRCVSCFEEGCVTCDSCTTLVVLGSGRGGVLS